MKIIISVLFVLLGISFSHASENEGKKLFEDKCGKCHLLERSLSGTRDLDTWQRIVLRMTRHSHGEISKAEAKVIAEYLAARDSDGKQPENKEIKNQEGIKINIVEKNEMFDFKKVRVNQFAGPGVCAECHSEIYEQWNGSMHSKAFTDPLWRAATKLFFKEAVSSEEVLEMKACVKCHTPLGFRSYSITSPMDNYDNLAEVAAQGIFCNWCHSISAMQHVGDAGYEVEPGAGENDPSTMLGPLKDSESSYHPSQYSALHTKSEFCGLCHNVSHAANKLPFEQTYTEWKQSPYNTGDPATTVNCQDCHMRQRPGIPSTGKTERPDNPGKASDIGPQRQHVWTHYFVGANAVITNIMGSDKHANMAIERLQNTADLELVKMPSYRKAELTNIQVKVTNSGAGHYLPTGLTALREMWLDLTIIDASGTVILKSGGLDKEGNIDKDAVQYLTRLGNNKGEIVMNIAAADKIIYDHRIPPKGYVLEKYSFYIPENAVSPLQVKAVLKYRSASQPLVRTLLGDKAPEMPVIDMAVVSEEINF